MMFPLPVRIKRMNRLRVSAHGAISPMSLALAQMNRAITRITPTLLVRRIIMGIADTADAYVHARIGTNTKEGTSDTHGARVPNAATRQAIAELEGGKGKRFNSVDDLMADLHAGD